MKGSIPIRPLDQKAKIGNTRIERFFCVCIWCQLTYTIPSFFFPLSFISLLALHGKSVCVTLVSEDGPRSDEWWPRVMHSFITDPSLFTFFFSPSCKANGSSLIISRLTFFFRRISLTWREKCGYVHQEWSKYLSQSLKTGIMITIGSCCCRSQSKGGLRWMDHHPKRKEERWMTWKSTVVSPHQRERERKNSVTYK